jgi:hypothetical protein
MVSATADLRRCPSDRQHRLQKGSARKRRPQSGRVNRYLKRVIIRPDRRRPANLQSEATIPRFHEFQNCLVYKIHTLSLTQ